MNEVAAAATRRTKPARLKAPFPYFGGKSSVAHLIWSALGDVDNLIIPFFGSGAELWAREECGGGSPRIETVNDVDCYLANFWRAVQKDPEQVAAHADWPVSEVDLHARHRYLVLGPESDSFRTRMMEDPEVFDVKFAGWWVWGICQWIGGGWCTWGDGPQRRPALSATHRNGIMAASGGTKAPRHRGTGEEEESAEAVEGGSPDQRAPQHDGHNKGRGIFAKRIAMNNGRGITGKRPKLSGNDQVGVQRQTPLLPAEWEQRPGIADGDARGVHSANTKFPDISGAHGCANGRGVLGQLPEISGDGKASGRGLLSSAALPPGGTCAQRRAWLVEWMRALCDRLRMVRVCCGDWSRVCSSRSVTTCIGITGVIMDPPYHLSTGRDMGLYARDCGEVSAAVRAWCIERGNDPKMRITLCGLEGEHNELEESRHGGGWKKTAWKSHGGYGNRSADGEANRKKERIWFSPHCLSGLGRGGLFA